MTELPGAVRWRAVVLSAVLALAIAVILALSPRAFSITQPAPLATPCTIAVDASTISPDERHMLVGAGFAANQRVSIVMGDERPTSVRADSAGGFTLAVRVPATLTGKTWRVEAVSQDHSCTATTSVAKNAPIAATPVRRDGLAIAGFPAIAAVIVGAFLAACGLLFVTVGRRRRP
jgi:hypothetical protein